MTRAQETTDRSGTTVDKYALVRLLGEGGMGAVYEARHTLVNKRFALKVLHPKYSEDQAAVQRMLLEAQAAAAIGHPNIVETFDFGRAEDGTHYLVMEYLEGRSLGQLLDDRGRLDVAPVAVIMRQVLGALAAAHAVGIVHRDLKPDNIFLASTRRLGTEVKLLDFGISKFTANLPEQKRLTYTGAVLGTPHYMSPEQAAGDKDVDLRADLWAVGVILQKCLTGAEPFDADNYNKLLFQIALEEPTPPRWLRPELPVALENVILKALTKDVSGRYGSAEEMMRALAPFTGSEPVIVEGLHLSDASSAVGGQAALPPVLQTGPFPVGAPPAPAPGSGRADHTVSPSQILGRHSAMGSNKRASRSRRIAMAAGGGVLLLTLVVVAALVTGRGDRGTFGAPSTMASAGTNVNSTPLKPDASAPPTTRIPLPTIRIPPSPAHGNATSAMSTPRPAPAHVSVRLVGLPRGATVRVDGTRVKPPLRLSTAGHPQEIEIEAPGYLPLSKTVVASAEMRALTIDMTRVSRRKTGYTYRKQRQRRRVPRPVPRRTKSGVYHAPWGNR